MCYSAQIKADYSRFVREYGAVLSIKDFFDLFWRRLGDPTMVIPRAVESAFASPETDEAREIRSMIARHAAAHLEDLQLKQAAQQERLAAAEAKLAKKTTKSATDERRIALNKIAAFQERIDHLQRAELDASDSRIFPGSYVPVMVWENGLRVFKPMRYRCRPWNMPESFDKEYPGCYNSFRAYLTVSKGIHSENQRSRRTNVFRCLGRVSDHSKGAKPGQPLVGRKSRCRSGCQSLLLVLAR